MTNTYRAYVESLAEGKTREDMTTCCDADYAFDCESEACAFNKDGMCRYHAVEDKMPVITEEDGCLSGIVEPCV